MTQLIDCYFLVQKREKKEIWRFLNRFVPLRAETNDDYINSTGDLVFTTADSLIDYLELNSNEEQLIYWRNLDVNYPIKFAMVVFTDDGQIILGYSIEARSFQEEYVESVFFMVQEFLGSTVCCMTVEEIAPSNSVEFAGFCKNRYVPDEQ